MDDYQSPAWIQRNANNVVAIDLDATISMPGEWRGEELFYPPMLGARDAMYELRRKGYIIIIYTVRRRHDLIAAYLKRHQLPYDYIESKPYATYYIDDRAIKHKDWEQSLQEVM